MPASTWVTAPVPSTTCGPCANRAGARASRGRALRGRHGQLGAHVRHREAGGAQHAGCSPYGQSVFAVAVDAIQSMDLAFDAFINEVDAGLMDRAEYRAKWYGESRK